MGIPNGWETWSFFLYFLNQDYIEEDQEDGFKFVIHLPQCKPGSIIKDEICFLHLLRPNSR